MIVRENINFERGIDPKEMLGVGIYTVHEFHSAVEATDYMIKILPILLHQKEIPKDLYQSFNHLNAEYANKIFDYIIKYITPVTKDPAFDDRILNGLWARLGRIPK